MPKVWPTKSLPPPNLTKKKPLFPFPHCITEAIETILTDMASAAVIPSIIVDNVPCITPLASTFLVTSLLHCALSPPCLLLGEPLFLSPIPSSNFQYKMSTSAFHHSLHCHHHPHYGGGMLMHCIKELHECDKESNGRITLMSLSPLLRQMSNTTSL